MTSLQPIPVAEADSPTSSLCATTGQIAAMVAGEVVGRDDLTLSRIATLDDADEASLAFIRSADYADAWAGSAAGAALVTRTIRVPGHDKATRALILVDDADRALVALLEHAAAQAAASYEPGIHPAAAVDPDASIDPTATIGPGCVIQAGATIGPRAVLVAQVFVGESARVGASTTIHPGVAIASRCVVGQQCLIHPGVVIGSDGFGFLPPSPPQRPHPIKVPHLGAVEIGDEVEIGANSCIDRGKLGPTTIGSGTKIDNLVQIAHNCTVGTNCLICGQSALAGSVTLGDGVTLGGSAKISDNTTIGDGATIVAYAGVNHTVPPGEIWMGVPAGPIPEAAANVSAARRLAATTREVRKLRKQVDQLLGQPSEPT